MKPILTVAFAMLATFDFAGSFDVSSLPTLSNYKVDPYLRTAVGLQKMGKEAACQALQSSMTTNRDMRSYYKHIVLCRMLFKARDGRTFRRPAMGGTTFFGGTVYADWPLEPIELVDGVPFLIAGSYRLGGGLEEADKYLRYCMDNCDWNTFQFRVVTAKEKADALDKLLKSPKWKGSMDSEGDMFSRQME
jgi:hypothetical protein